MTGKALLPGHPLEADEVWVNEYDAVSRFQPGSWEPLDSIRLEDTGSLLSRLPIGGFWFPPDESHCVVARPMSGDVVFLDTGTLRSSSRSTSVGNH